jgi:hypothetical protein
MEYIEAGGIFPPASSSLSPLIGRNFGVVTDIRIGPNGNLFAVSRT